MAKHQDVLASPARHVYQATLPDGSIVRRTFYSAPVTVVAAKATPDDGGNWYPMAWCCQPDTVKLAISLARTRSYISAVETVPVVEVS